eukprot:COSAG04_NODE_26248_length_297_cov_1.020202_1_plen_76_part_10
MRTSGAGSGFLDDWLLVRALPQRGALRPPVTRYLLSRALIAAPFQTETTLKSQPVRNQQPPRAGGGNPCKTLHESS